jgi:hypothetical protein
MAGIEDAAGNPAPDYRAGVTAALRAVAAGFGLDDPATAPPGPMVIDVYPVRREGWPRG